MEDRAIPFRLPDAVAARLSVSFLGLAVCGMLLESLVLQQSRFDVKTFAVVACAFNLLTAALYVVLRTRSWVAVSHQGLRGRFLWFFWRTVPWDSISGAFAKPSWFIRGYQFGRCDELGIPLPFAGVFVPAAIFQAPEFAKAIERFAPSVSPLLRIRQHAI